MNDVTTNSKIMCRPNPSQETGEATRSTHYNKGNTNEIVSTTTPDEKGENKNSPPSNEYVLNFAFFSFFSFMMIQIFFALMAKSQSMLTDSLAMSVDSFTYLFNLAAERLKHRSSQSFQNLSLEERKRRKKLIRLYLEFIPPVISVTALVVVSAQALMDAITTITNPLASEAQSDEPNIGIMLLFSALNLGLDVMNVLCFSKVGHFSIATVKKEEGDKKEIASIMKIEETPPTIIVDISNNSSFESNSSGGVECDDGNTESVGLLGINMPNYGSQRSDAEWGDELSLEVVHGDGSQSDGLTSEDHSAASVETGDSLGSGAVSAPSNSIQSKRNKAAEIGIGGDGLDYIPEGDENSNDGQSETSDANGSNDNDSETSDRGFNMNMCSAYTVSIATFQLD
jgi:Co/Zn/Cd efflux system component